ncbi:MAG: hypothetical protein ACOX7U_01315 [Desulfitobacteriia bacterium]
MRKIYWLVTPLVFCLGLTVGVFGHAAWGTNLPLGFLKNNDLRVTEAAKIEPGNYPAPGDQNGAEDPDPSLAEHEKIEADYKQAVGLLFDAWKVNDIKDFRQILSRAYTGEILESHVKKAEKYLSEGIGLYVSQLQFDNVVIEAADEHSATVDAVYRYTVQDYDLDEQYPFGKEISHFVHVKANLVKIDGKWLITSETVI